MKNKTIIVGLIFTSLLASCSDMLEYSPLDHISDKSFWKTPEDFSQATANFYSFLLGYTGEDRHSDIFCWHVEESKISAGDILVPYEDGGYSDRYAAIRQINYVLQKASEFKSPEKIKIPIGESYFFRAYEYIKLYERYGGIIWIDKVLDVNSPDLNTGRLTREETFKKISNDLDSAIHNLPIEKEIADKDKGRVSKEAVYSLKARINLFEGTWRKFRSKEDWQNLLDEAIECSDFVINSNSYKIFNYPEPIKSDFSGGLGVFSYKYVFILDNTQCNWANKTKKDNKEFILSRRFDRNSNITANYNYFQGFSPTRKLMDMYLCSNGLPIKYNGQTNALFKGYTSYTSEFENRDTRLTSIVQQEGKMYYKAGSYSLWGNPNPPSELYRNRFGADAVTGYFSNKFLEETYNSSSSQTYDYPEIRYAEVLLINAEAKFERNENISDDDLDKTINLLRERGQVAKLTNSLVNSNGLSMREQIRNERTVELQMEGFRLNDLKRWNTATAEMKKDVSGFYIARRSPWAQRFGSIKTDTDGFYLYQSSEDRKWFDYYELFPIPKKELQLNKNLKQNPGYEE